MGDGQAHLSADGGGRAELVDRRDRLAANASAERRAAGGEVDGGDLNGRLSAGNRRVGQREGNGNNDKSLEIHGLICPVFVM